MSVMGGGLDLITALLLLVGVLIIFPESSFPRFSFLVMEKHLFFSIVLYLISNYIKHGMAFLSKCVFSAA